MRGFGKVAGIGFASVFALLLSMSMSGVVLANGLPGPFVIEAPKAEIKDLFMYPGEYEGVPVLVQEIGELNTWAGQTITWYGTVADVPVEVAISMDSAVAWNLLIKGTSIGSPQGASGEMSLGQHDSTVGLRVSKMEMDDLNAVVYYVYLESLNYNGMQVCIYT